MYIFQYILSIFSFGTSSRDAWFYRLTSYWIQPPTWLMNSWVQFCTISRREGSLSSSLFLYRTRGSREFAGDLLQTWPMSISLGGSFLGEVNSILRSASGVCSVLEYLGWLLLYFWGSCLTWWKRGLFFMRRVYIWIGESSSLSRSSDRGVQKEILILDEDCL